MKIWNKIFSKLTKMLAAMFHRQTGNNQRNSHVGHLEPLRIGNFIGLPLKRLFVNERS